MRHEPSEYHGPHAKLALLAAKLPKSLEENRMSMHATEIYFKVTVPFKLPNSEGIPIGEPLNGDYVAIPKIGSNPTSYHIHEYRHGKQGTKVANAYIEMDASRFELKLI